MQYIPSRRFIKTLIGYYEKNKLVYMKPSVFLEKTKNHIHSDPFRRENVVKIKEKLLKGIRLDPPFIEYKNKRISGFQGRHRATASKELGIRKIPVLLLYNPLMISRNEREKYKLFAKKQWILFREVYF